VKDTFMRDLSGLGAASSVYAFFDVNYEVRLLRTGKYSDSELLSIATAILPFAKQRRMDWVGSTPNPPTGMHIEFWSPDGGSYGNPDAVVDWGPDGRIMTSALPGDYSSHRFKLVVNGTGK